MSEQGSKTPCPVCESPDVVRIPDRCAPNRDCWPTRCVDCGNVWWPQAERIVFTRPGWSIVVDLPKKADGDG